MRITRNDMIVDRHGRQFKQMSFAQRVELRKHYVATIPRWRHPSVGYLACCPIMALGLLTTVGLRELLPQFYFPGSVLMLTVLLVAMLWGVGPALCTVIVSTLVVDYYFVPPIGELDIVTWQGALQLLPYIVSGVVVAILTSQRERARLRALYAEQELQGYAKELEETNRRLEDANQVKDQFISMASHELKTPITTIRGQAQLMLKRLSKLKADTVELEDTRVTLQKINEQTSRLTKLIDEMLDVSSIRAGKVELHKKKCDIRDICGEVVEDQRLLTGREIVLEMPAYPIKLSVDPDRFSQVLVNLVGNAVKYSSDNMPVEVNVRQEDGQVFIEVSDHGKGIAKDQLERIFETFYRTPDAQSSAKKGLGLGLAISKDIVERHDGRIWCESDGEQGSRFFVALPIK